MRDIDRAVRACDRLRPVLPLLLAVSASSPFLDGLDSGLHSARTQIFTKSFPRCGVPDAYGSWAAYRDYLDLLVRTGSIVEDTQVWWSVRPHFSFGTVEVRICDAQATAAEAEGLSALIVACVLQAARDEDEGRPSPHAPRRLVEENLWRAIRFGLDGRMIDLDAGTEYPSAAIADRLLTWTAPVRAEHGLEPAPPGRQRRPAPAGAGPVRGEPGRGLRRGRRGDAPHLRPQAGGPSTVSTQDPGGPGRQPTEDELRAAYEAELKRLRVEDVVLQTVVSLLNLGGRRAGVAPGTEDEADPEQVRLAIEGARALLPLVEDALGPDAAQLREAIAQLQLAYARMAGGRGPAEPGGEPGGPQGDGEEGGQGGTGPGPGEPPGPGAPGDAVRSGRLWVPGQ